MSRNDLLAALKRHTVHDDVEESHVARTMALIETSPDCFQRTLFTPGHVTGSALLISADGGQVLMNHHKALDKWLCFGGHADRATDIMNVARREVAEESGIADITPVTDSFIDVDIHTIPANPRKSEPEHEHFDIRYLFRARSDRYALSDESLALRWCSYEQARSLNASPEMARLLAKWQDLR